MLPSTCATLLAYVAEPDQLTLGIVGKAGRMSPKGHNYEAPILLCERIAHFLLWVTSYIVAQLVSVFDYQCQFGERD